MKKLLPILLCFPMIGFGQTTIPDANFEQALINLGYDTPPINGSVPTANINTVTNLNIQYQNISDLTGIEDFTALTSLNCKNNQLTSLDVSQNTALTILNCDRNNLQDTLDLTSNTLLIDLRCVINQITSLNVTNCTQLTSLYCYQNSLSVLDISTNINLLALHAQSNNLDSLDLSNNPLLHHLWCGINNLTELDLSNNLGMILLRCEMTQITSLDLSNHSNLVKFQACNSQLTSLDIRNGNNINANPQTNSSPWGGHCNETDGFCVFNNPSLFCVNVDDSLWSSSNWTLHLDTQTTFSTNCPPVVFGCTDSLANNYNPLATMDDSSCCYINITQNDTTICFGDSMVLSVLGLNGNSPSNLYNGLIAYYPFLGSTDDISGNNRHLTNTGATLTTDRHGNINSAYHFDGVSGYLENQSFPTNTSKYTFSCWAKSYGVQNDVGIATQSGGSGIASYGISSYNSQIKARHRKPPLMATSAGGFGNNWTHIITTWDGDTVRLYVDGVFQSNLAVATHAGFLNTFRVGNVHASNSPGGTYANSHFYGDIDDVLVWNRALSATEVWELFNTNILWSTSDTTASITVNPSQTTTYYVTQTENGVSCTDSVTVTVNNPTTSTFTAIAPICAGDPLTLPTTSIEGFTGTWSPAINNIGTTTYTFTPTAGQCATNATMTVTVNLLPIVTANANPTNICMGSPTILTGSGTAATYIWDNGVTDSLVFNPTTTTTYTVTGTDASACFNTAQITVTVNPLPIISAPITNVSCNGLNDGVIVASATGTPPFQYSLGGGLSQTTGIFPNLSAGTYYIDVTDVNSCTSNQTVIITEPLPLSISVNSTDETSVLNDGSADAIILGGVPAYIYNWSDGQTTSTATNLSPGLYTVTVTDLNGCAILDSTTVNAYTSTSVINIKNINKTLIKITDLLGRETKQTNQPLFYIYDDGTVEKRIVIE